MTIPNVFSLKMTAIAVAIAVAVSSAFTFTATRAFYVSEIRAIVAENKAEIEAANSEHARKLLRITENKNDAEQQLLKAKGDIQDEFEKSKNASNTRISELLNSNFRLRQQPQKNGGTGSSNANNSGGAVSNNGSNSGEGLLPKQTSDFLLGFAGEADSTLERLRACKAWEASVRRSVETFKRTLKTENLQQK